MTEDIADNGLWPGGIKKTMIFIKIKQLQIELINSNFWICSVNSPKQGIISIIFT